MPTCLRLRSSAPALPVAGANKGTGVGTLGSGEHPVPEEVSSPGEVIVH